MKIEMTDINDLTVDDRAQRAMSTAHARAIGGAFDPRMCGAIIISRRPNGTSVILDGQHRVQGAKVKGYVGKLPAIIYDDLSLEEEAQLFLALNSSKPVQALDKFKVEVTAGEAASVAINSIVEDEGFFVGQKAQGARAISAVGALRDVYRIHGAKALRLTLRIILAAWDDTPTSATGPRMIKALGSVVAMPKSEVTGLIDTLKNTSAASILGEADFIHDMYPNVTKARADVEHICKLYNKGLKKADKIGMVAA